MAKLLYVCCRAPEHARTIASRVEQACARLRPDHLPKLPLEFSHGSLISYGLVNPAPTIRRTADSLVLGAIFGEAPDWQQPRAEVPDGTFALIRASQEFVELCADFSGSRTIWYYHDEQFLIASTSQRAIVMLLGSLAFETKCLPWMLSTGSLGPSHGWDQRLQRLEPASTVLLNRQTWQLERTSQSIQFQPQPGTDAEHEQRLLAALDETFASLPLTEHAWTLPLSGGYDSRGILLMLQRVGQEIARLPTVTWGVKSSLTRTGNDAWVAERLAAALDVPHRYCPTDLSDEPLAKVVTRFLLAGEGRIDHLSAYMDGFQIWKTFYQDGICGIIRGDEGFGWCAVTSALTVRLSTGIGLCADDANLRKFLPPEMLAQDLPAAYRQRADETLEEWRDRLYHQYRLPIFLAALTKLKSGYVEQMNPLLSRKILAVVRSLPDRLRTDKMLFKRIVEKLSPPIGFATSSAIAEPEDLFRQPAFLEMLREKLSAATAAELFPAELRTYVLGKLDRASRSGPRPSRKWKSTLKGLLPNWLKNRLRDTLVCPPIPAASLGFRMYLACAMREQLQADAQALGPFPARD